MSESQNAELAHWQNRVDDQTVSLERLREQRDLLLVDIADLQKELTAARSLISRMKIAMSEGQEL